MEMSKKTRYTLLFTFLVSLVVFFIVGYMLGHVKPSKVNYDSEIREVIDYLDEYYYKEYDKDKFVKSYIKGGVSSLNDPYTYFYYDENTNNTSSYTGYGIGTSSSSLGLTVGSVMNESPAYKAGIRRGDYIIGVDDIKMGKNSIDDISTYLSSAKEEVTMYLLRNYKEYSVKIKKEVVIVNPLIEYKLLGNVGYIKINEFEKNSSTKFKEALDELETNNIKGLIIDVRNNPGGLATEVASILRNFLTGTDAFLYLDEKASDTPTVYRATDAEKKGYDIKVLINENSASASEVFALCMNRVMNYDLVGSNTYGKGVFQQDFKLSSIENAYLHITCGYWYGPKNKETNERECIDKVGVAPTIEFDTSEFIPFPINEETYSIDMASDTIKDMEIMLKTLGYNVRVDGYFDSNLESVLETNYSSNVLNYSTQKKIYDAYITYINDINNDSVINKALSLFE